jgi:hypothetical protein
MLTVKVNSTVFGLVHKGSMHMAKNTVPDVCKTPSPAGPVPIPYPVIISKSSDLKNGTTTVTADGGQMIAVKDCEYASCNGDEAGTAGGVVSSTNMKEAKFILFSFDVKMDGKNACRLGDKMTMNHQNTVCMGGTFPSNCKPNELPLSINCDDKKSDPPTTPAWTDCMCKQFCAKVKAFNKRKKKKKTISPSPGHAPAGSPAKVAYDAGIDSFVATFEAKVRKFGANSKQVKKCFIHKCAHDEWKDPPSNGKLPMDRSRATGMNPDHVHDAALNGGLTQRNLKWMDARANQTIKTTGWDDTKHTKLKANPNCNCR